MALDLVCTALVLFLYVVIARVVVSWFPPGGEFLESARRVLTLATEWLLGPLRRTLPPVRLGAAALDLSPLVVFIGIAVLQRIIC